jgi:hypothetical protein
MKRLPLPNIAFSEALKEAISGIGSPAVRTSHTIAFADPNTIEADYAQRANEGTLYALPRVDTRDDPVILGALCKSDLMKLYSDYFVPERKSARRIYEAIKVTAGGKCPLCGGVGHVRTLDHYLPKANFPLYSVLPTNLVPCCRDCNSEKLNSFADERQDQTLHPYFDHDRFFNQRWIQARVIPKSPPVLEYFVSTPDDWDDDSKSRVHAHFTDYRLAEKFSVEAAADLPETIQTRRTTMCANTAANFSSYLAEKSNTSALPINNWRRVMFSALAADPWFCNETFA